MAANTKETGRIVYFEPNNIPGEATSSTPRKTSVDNATWSPEDMNIFVDLQVAIPSRVYEATDAKWYNNDFNDAKYQSILSGVKLHGSEGDERYLTDDWTTVSYQEIRGNNAGSKELLGLNSINIIFDSHMYPRVTMNFTDVRGAALMEPEELRAYDTNNPAGAKNASVMHNFFGNVFKFPYPRFLLTVKGFYGTCVTFVLSVEDFKTEFSSETGDFNVTIKFIGNMYGLYTDIPMNFLLVAPYIGSKGELNDYWIQQRENGNFRYIENGQTAGGIKTFVEFFHAYQDTGNTEGMLDVLETSEAFSNTTNERHKSELLKELTNKLNERANSLKGSNGKFSIKRDGEKLLILSKQRSLQNEVATATTEEYKKLVKNFEVDYEDTWKTIDGLISASDGVSWLLTGGALSLEKIPEERTIPGWHGDISNINEFDYYSVIDYSKISEFVNDEVKKVTADIEKNYPKISKELADAFKVTFGFTPTIENVMRMLFAHLDTFMHCFYTTIGNISKEDRRLSDVNWKLEMTDIEAPRDVTDEISLPPFTGFYKQREKNKDQIERLYPGDEGSLMRISEVGLVESIMAGVKQLKEIAEEANNSDEFRSDAEENGKPAMQMNFTPSLLSDFYCKGKNPYNEIVHDGNVKLSMLIYFFLCRYFVWCEERGEKEPAGIFMSNEWDNFRRSTAFAAVKNAYKKEELEDKVEKLRKKGTYTPTDEKVVDDVLWIFDGQYRHSAITTSNASISITLEKKNIDAKSQSPAVFTDESIRLCKEYLWAETPEVFEEGYQLDAESFYNALPSSYTEDISLSAQEVTVPRTPLKHKNYYLPYALSYEKTDKGTYEYVPIKTKQGRVLAFSSNNESYPWHEKISESENREIEITSDEFSDYVANADADSLWIPYLIDGKNNLLLPKNKPQKDEDYFKAAYGILKTLAQGLSKKDGNISFYNKVVVCPKLWFLYICAKIWHGDKDVEYCEKFKKDISKCFENWVIQSFKVPYGEACNDSGVEMKDEGSLSGATPGTGIQELLISLFHDGPIIVIPPSPINDISLVIAKKTNETKKREEIQVPAANLLVRQFFTKFKEALEESAQSEASSSNGEDYYYDVDSTDSEENVGMREQLYYALKNLYDRWLAMETEGEFKLKSPEKEIEERGKLLNESTDIADISEPSCFSYVDSFYNDIGGDFVLDVGELFTLLKDSFEGEGNYNVYDFIGRLCSKNKLLLKALPIYGRIYDGDTLKNMFTPHTLYNTQNRTARKLGNAYVIMYPYEASHFLNIEQDKSMGVSFANDSFDIADTYGDPTPEAIKIFGSDSEGKRKVCAFGVTPGRQNQSYFTKINVNMDHPRLTDFAIKNMFALGDSAKRGATVPRYGVGQNLYSVYSNRSYDCSVEMLGCANIMPMMYFQLNNVPMFKGTYMITKVEHNIQNNSMTTRFTGTRQPRYYIKMEDSVFNYALIKDFLNKAGGGGGFMPGLDNGSITRSDDGYLTFSGSDSGAINGGDSKKDSGPTFYVRSALRQMNLRMDGKNVIPMKTTDSSSKCATAVQGFLNAGFNGYEDGAPHRSANDFSGCNGYWMCEFLANMGFKIVAHRDMIDSFQPQDGDVYVLRHGVYGHVAMYGDGQWVSDFRQAHWNVYRKSGYTPPNVYDVLVYRYTGKIDRTTERAYDGENVVKGSPCKHVWTKKGGENHVHDFTVPEQYYDKMVEAFVKHESNNNPQAIGDNGSAVGVLQMWPIMVREANNCLGEDRYKYYGKGTLSDEEIKDEYQNRKKNKLPLDDLIAQDDRLNREKSIEMFKIVQKKRNPGRSFEKACDLWNGWTWHPDTYCRSVKKFYDELI